jgi:hypothetical protein
MNKFYTVVMIIALILLAGLSGYFIGKDTVHSSFQSQTKAIEHIQQQLDMILGH